MIGNKNVERQKPYILVDKDLLLLKHRYLMEKEVNLNKPLPHPDLLGRTLGITGTLIGIAGTLIAYAAFQEVHPLHQEIFEIKAQIKNMEIGGNELRHWRELDLIGDCLMEWKITGRDIKFFNLEVCQSERDLWLREFKKK